MMNLDLNLNKKILNYDLMSESVEMLLLLLVTVKMLLMMMIKRIGDVQC